MLVRKSFLATLLAAATVCWLSTAWAQTGKKKEEEEEKPGKKPAATKPAEKPAEDTEKGKGGEEEETRPKKAGLPGTGAKVNLQEEAKRAPHPRIKEIFDKLAIQCDIVVSTSGPTWEVEPLKKRFEANDQKPVTFKNVKDGAERTLPRDAIASVSHYEIRVLDGARQLVQSGLDRPDAKGMAPVSRSKLLKYVEMLLGEGLRFHSDVKEKRLRTDGWLGMEDDFKKELQQVQIGQIRALTAEADWDGGEALSSTLRKLYPPTADLMAAIEAHYVAMAEALIDKNEQPTARQRLEFFLRQYSTGVPPAVEQVQKRLQERARALLSEARAHGAKGDVSKALDSVQKAQDVWPTLAGLSEERAKYLKDRPILRVGVRHLPTQISPTTALTDADLAACQLVFDSLFRLRAGPAAHEGYESKMGFEIRATSQGGFEFLLPPDLKWSDGKPFTAADIVRSQEILIDPRSPYYDPLARDLMEIRSEDDYQLSISFKRGHLDLLSFLTFPLLPASRLVAERSPRDPAFGKTPIGTGPFLYKGVEGNEAIFEANPNYRRPHAPNGPGLKEVRFVQYTDFQQAKKNVADGVWQILFDLTSKEREEMAGLANVQVSTPTQPADANSTVLMNPRLWLLLPNHRKALGSVELRKAISMSLDREEILNAVFRGPAKKDHQVLNGPYPVHSWAFNPQLQPASSPPYKPAVAAGLLNQVKQRGNIPNLTLKFPNDDPQAAAACNLIVQQLAKVGIPVTAAATSRADIVLDLNKERPDFDLVYWNYDFPNETLDLWPLLDPRSAPPNGRNYLGEAIPEIEAGCRRVQGRRDFKLLQTLTHQMHDDVLEKHMVVIPLWQLDHHVAVHKSLRITRLHPIWVFDDVEEWKLVPVN